MKRGWHLHLRKVEKNRLVWFAEEFAGSLELDEAEEPREAGFL